MQPLPPPKDRPSYSGTENRNSSRPGLEPASSDPAVASAATGPKRRKHRGGKKRKNRRQSFAAQSSDVSALPETAETMSTDPLVDAPDASSPPPFFRRRAGRGSSDSLDSDALLDHRDQPTIRNRRESRQIGTSYAASQRSGLYPSSGLTRLRTGGEQQQRWQGKTKDQKSPNGPPTDDDIEELNEETPLIATALSHRSPKEYHTQGLYKSRSRGSSKSSKRKTGQLGQSYPGFETGFHVNNPPSVPASPTLQPFDNIGPSDFLSRSPGGRKTPNKDALIDIDDLDDDEDDDRDGRSADFRPNALQRHQTVHLPVEGDVCFPGEAESEMAFEDYEQQNSQQFGSRRRNRRRAWPQLWVLDEWSQQEKEQQHRAEVSGAKKINEPVLIEGRLRPQKHVWHRLDEDAPYRYTYFNEEYESTIHAQTISDLVQEGSTFQELFLPEPPLLEDSSDSSDDGEEAPEAEKMGSGSSTSPRQNDGRDKPVLGHRLNSLLQDSGRSASRTPSIRLAAHSSGEGTPSKSRTGSQPKPTRYGPRPTFWLDVMSPTDQEMRVLCKAFGIHALTSEDIMMQEAREKVELFRNYYFINYRTFEQDSTSEDHLEPINMYVIVFRQGILTFHFSQIPHPANVRRRIRQLTDYLILSSDWISYAIIDDITDVYQPLIHNIEQEVDDIDELILRAFSNTNALSSEDSNPSADDSKSDSGEKGPSGIDMLRRVGECRKKVMALYRLLGNKADVIKGFAKRCNEQWEVAPKSEIGLYLGDIQDHILTMTSNLSHYETLLSRAHSNYLAQVSIRMNERQEQTSDVLGKLTVIGTIVLPMNIICGMWGMNVQVPGQDVENLNWFWSITAGLVVFALICYFVCKKMYKIV